MLSIHMVQNVDRRHTRLNTLHTNRQHTTQTGCRRKFWYDSSAHLKASSSSPRCRGGGGGRAGRASAAAGGCGAASLRAASGSLATVAAAPGSLRFAAVSAAGSGAVMPAVLGVGPAVCDGRPSSEGGERANVAAAPSAGCNGCGSAGGETAAAARPSGRLPSGCAATAAEAAAAVAPGGRELPCELLFRLTGGDCLVSAISGLSSGVAASPSAWCKSAASSHTPSKGMPNVQPPPSKAHVLATHHL